MDRLLVVTPIEVRFHLEIGKTARAKIRLHNLMHTMPVAFKVYTTAPHRYTVPSQSVIIHPLEEHVLEITMAVPMTSLPKDLPYSHDKVYVKSLMIPTGKATHAADVDKLFDIVKKNVFTDATLKIVFTGKHVLWRLAVNGSMECVREVLRDTDINAKDEQDRTALFIAAEQGNIGAVKALVAGKCNVNDKDCDVQTPLFKAVLGGHFEIVKMLLDVGAELEHKNGCGWTCLHVAAARNRPDIAKLLLDAGADKDAIDERGRTPLHEAASMGNSKVLYYLVRSGADLEKQSCNGDTPLHEAAAKGSKDAVLALVEEGADYEARNHEKKTSRDLAHEMGKIKLLDVMHEQRMLERGAQKNDVKGVRECLRTGACTDICDQYGWTALHRAAFKGHVEVVRLLLEHQFDINMKDERGYTPLCLAIAAGHKEVVELLLNHKAAIRGDVTALASAFRGDVAALISAFGGDVTALASALAVKHSSIRLTVEDAKVKLSQFPKRC